MSDTAPDTFAEAPVPASEDVDAAGQTEHGDELQRLISENAALKEQVLRVAADAENAKRRAEKEANDGRAYAIQRFARDLFDAADSLSRATQAAPKDASDAATKNFVVGVDMTEKALQAAFERNGLKRLRPSRGDRFDPHMHQAMTEMEAEGVGPGAVVSVMQDGYELFGRVLRPALVAVSPKAAASQAASGEGYARSEPDESGAGLDTRA